MYGPRQAASSMPMRVRVPISAAPWCRPPPGSPRHSGSGCPISPSRGAPPPPPPPPWRVRDQEAICCLRITIQTLRTELSSPMGRSCFSWVFPVWAPKRRCYAAMTRRSQSFGKPANASVQGTWSAARSRGPHPSAPVALPGFMCLSARRTSSPVARVRRCWKVPAQGTPPRDNLVHSSQASSRQC